MAELISMLAATAGQGGVADVDPNFNQTVLLLHGDGTNGAQNNTFLDSSSNNFTITRNGNTTQGTFSPFSAPDGRWSNYFDGTGDYLTIPDDAALEIPTQDFTIEAWVYLSSLPASGSQYTIIQKGRTGTSNFEYSFEIDNNSGSMRLVCRTSSNGSSLTTALGSTISLVTGSWNHVAVTRTSTTASFWFNGVAAGTGTVDGTTYTGSAVVAIGANDAGSSPLVGYISNLRVVKGTAITPPSGGPTSPLTAVSGTSLLTCQSNRFVDNSTNNFAITRNGDVKVTPFSPFAPTAAYDASVNGGSGYFDGTGDYLTTPSDAALGMGTGDFTIECFYYHISRASTDGILCPFTGNLNITILTTGVLGYYDGANFHSSSQTVPLNEWGHICVTRTSGTLKMYYNGSEVLSRTDTTNFATTYWFIGTNSVASTDPSHGYISNVRIVKGTAITPPSGGPTSLLTAISGTELLLNFTNAGIFDNTGKNNLETAGNAQIDTTTKKFGTGSMEFDGTGDWLFVPSSTNLDLGLGPYTIEFWAYPNSLSANAAHLVAANSTNGLVIYVTNAKTALNKFSVGDVLAYNTPLNTSAWTHVAVVREGTGSNQTKIYINGTAQATGTDNNNWNVTTNFTIGGNNASGSTQHFNGFIDDLRITKGVARTITVPTKAYPDL